LIKGKRKNKTHHPIFYRKVNNAMPKNFPSEFVFQVFTLLLAFIFIHGAYVTIIRPNADAFLALQQQRLAADSSAVEQRNFYVVIRDYEQESCFILFAWALAILALKGGMAQREQNSLSEDILQLPEGLPIGPEDSRQLLERITELPEQQRKYLLPQTLQNAIVRFSATRSIQAAATAVREMCESRGDRLESELSIIRYIAWAIPSVGFICTVRGIGAALAQAHQAVSGDITGVTRSLGVAFNSTFIALVISIILMFFIHQVQLMQERLTLDTESYCQRYLINKLRVK
jgi:biopolymer transport protein ExbB/TolQ